MYVAFYCYFSSCPVFHSSTRVYPQALHKISIQVSVSHLENSGTTDQFGNHHVFTLKIKIEVLYRNDKRNARSFTSEVSSAIPVADFHIFHRFHNESQVLSQCPVLTTQPLSALEGLDFSVAMYQVPKEYPSTRSPSQSVLATIYQENAHLVFDSTMFCA